MKILFFTLFLYFSIFAARSIYAANNTLISNYPATNGSYNRVILQNLQSAITSCSAATNGLLFFNTSTNTLQLCINGNATPVPSGETCFNRFCSSGGPQPCPAGDFSTGNNCPSGYTQATASGSNIVDSFTTATSYTVYSTVCCNTSSIVLP